MMTLVALNLRSNAVMTDITSRDVACSRRTTLLTMKSVTCNSIHVAVAVNSLTFMHCQGLDLGYTFVTDFCYRLIRGSLIIARFSAVGMGVGLYTGWLIREYIR